MRKEAQEPQTLIEAIRYFSDPETCHDFVVGLRWPNGVACVHCGTKNVGFIKTRQRFQCKGCRRQFSVKVGTIFEDSPIPLDKWLAAFWMIANAKNGISSYEIHRAIGVSQKSAWYVLHRIRLAMQTGTFRKLSGEVEADETYIGGKARNMHPGKRKAKGRGAVGKAIVMGLLERHGEVRTKVIPNSKKRTVQKEVRENVEVGSEVFTDALSSYDGLASEFAHDVINHAECYAKGKVHTNGLENFWSLLKRGIKGTYVSVEPFHLFRYLDEQAFRFNTRKRSDWDRFQTALRQIVQGRLTYASLTGNIP